MKQISCVWRYYAVGLAVLLTAPSVVAAQPTSTPNIVVILTDDQGYADLSYNPEHRPEVSTPHMDDGNTLYPMAGHDGHAPRRAVKYLHPV